MGSLEVGEMADLRVLDEDPLADRRNTAEIRFVMKNGRLYDDLGNYGRCEFDAVAIGSARRLVTAGPRPDDVVWIVLGRCVSPPHCGGPATALYQVSQTGVRPETRSSRARATTCAVRQQHGCANKQRERSPVGGGDTGMACHATIGRSDGARDAETSRARCG